MAQPAAATPRAKADKAKGREDEGHPGVEGRQSADEPPDDAAEAAMGLDMVLVDARPRARCAGWCRRPGPRSGSARRWPASPDDGGEAGRRSSSASWAGSPPAARSSSRTQGQAVRRPGLDAATRCCTAPCRRTSPRPAPPGS